MPVKYRNIGASRKIPTGMVEKPVEKGVGISADPRRCSLATGW
jgi:hypothetical protein